MSFKPFIYQLPSLDTKDIFKDNEVSISSNIQRPLFSLGFHSFIHRTKSAMAITNKLETKNKFYYVVNPFEHTINDYKDDIAHYSETFLNKPNILSRAFYKLWEMLYLFDIAGNKKMTMVGLAEGPGSFIQAFVEFREQYYELSNDTIYGLTLNDDKHIGINKDMVDNINKRYKNLITILSSVNGKKKSTNNMNGDLTKVSTIKYLRDNIKSADLITADGGFEWKDENFQEQEAYQLILGEIISAISIQAKGGSFVLKIFETFTHTTIKLIYLLSTFYENVYIYKPFFSRDTNSEKYIICKGFKYDTSSDILQKNILYLEETLKKCDTNKFINDIFPKFELSNEYINIFKYINIIIANIQQIMINKVVTYIKSNNYFGDEYHMYRDKQIEANKWWIDKFLTDELKDNISLVKETIKYNESELNLFIKKLII
jgi:23S rRNA U2552 (ribose-2'-O)-methylase RlmE/FtsJ